MHSNANIYELELQLTAKASTKLLEEVEAELCQDDPQDQDFNDTIRNNRIRVPKSN